MTKVVRRPGLIRLIFVVLSIDGNGVNFSGGVLVVWLRPKGVDELLSPPLTILEMLHPPWIYNRHGR